MSEALIFVAPGHEEVEMLTVVDMLRRADIQIQMVSITDSLTVTSSHNVTLQTDILLKDANFEEAKILILPGGMPGTLNLKACEPLCRQLVHFNEEGKTLAAVCAAPSVLGELGILAGKKATCFPSFEDKLLDAEYVKAPVVADDNVITSRGMGTCIEFAAAIITALRDEKTAEAIKTKIIYQDDYSM